MTDIIALFIFPLSISLYMAWRLEKDKVVSNLEMTTENDDNN
jgi:hypothetical protein